MGPPSPPPARAVCFETASKTCLREELLAWGAAGQCSKRCQRSVELEDAGVEPALADGAGCRAVDFGAGWFDLDYAYGQQRSMNPPGQSPPLCAEF